jgi:MYXO-CTERM domain-containing protein
MSNNDARRVCGIAIGLGISLVSSSDAFATRGRPKVANNTIVTDTGSLIRGARVSLDIWDETPTQADVDTMKNSRGLNAFHIYAEYPGSNKAAGYNVDKVDKVVDMADTSDLYVVLTIGSGGANGSFTGSFVTAFWAFYAPRYKDKTHVIYEVCNEPQAWSAPYNSNTLTMEKNAFTQIRGLAPDTHIMMMSYSQPNNWTQAASECAGLGITWDNASVAFHTYGIDGKEDSTLTSFYKALQAKGIAYACTEPNLTLKAITTKLFERDGVSETQFINVKDIATNTSAFSSWITSNNICWTPDFGTWPSCSGTVPGSGGARGSGGSSGTGGRGGTSSTVSGRGGAIGVGGAAAVGGASGSGGISGSSGQPGSGGAGSGGALAASGGSSAGGASAATGVSAGGGVGLGGSPSGGAVGGKDASNGCNCAVGMGRGAHGRGAEGGIALLLGLLAFAFIRRRP